MNSPDTDTLNKYRVEQGVKAMDADLNRDNEPYVENELDLKSNIILRPEAKSVNPMNKSDLVLGIVKDPETKRNLEYWKKMQVIFHEAGMNDTATFYEDMVLTTLNLHRSHEGQQQKFIISRIKQNRLELEEKKKGFEERTKII
jgi:hypothetical protein